MVVVSADDDDLIAQCGTASGQHADDVLLAGR
jgi:hypothetical protein